MSVLLAVARFFLPPSVKRKRLTQLFTLTADAFGADAPCMEDASFDEFLDRYARFTCAEATKAGARPEQRERVKERLYKNAYLLGSELRGAYRIRTLRDALRMGRIIYKALNIEFRANGERGIVMKRCFFSDYYSANECELISSLDEGMMAGLTAGMRLRFVKRITDGDKCCEAFFGIEDSAS